VRINGTIVATWTNALLRMARLSGLRLEPLLAEACVDLPALGCPEARLPFEAHAQLFRRVPALLDDPGIGLDVGLGADTGAMGLVGLLAERCRTVGDALGTVASLNALANQASWMRWWIDGDRVFVLDGHTLDGRPYHPTMAEATMVFWVARLASATGLPAAMLELWLTHDRHRGWASRDERVPARVLFKQPFNAVILPRAALEAPMLMAHPMLQHHLARLASEELPRLPVVEDPVSLVEWCVGTRLVGGPPSLASVARSLGTSVRSLQRQLETRGRSYSEIVDGVRRERARRLLLVPGTSVDAIALALGYQGSRPFRRACLRWFGHTPSALRHTQ
jgi:AraC-like DNA-binding protein